MKPSGTTQKLVELHLQKVGMAPRSKRLSVLDRETRYLAKLISENGAISLKALSSRLLAAATEAGIDRKEATVTIETAVRWTAASNELLSIATPTTHKKGR